MREFWYYQRPDILEYMQTAYRDLDIQLLPNIVIQELNKKNNLVSQLSDLHESLSTTILSQSDIVQSFPSIVHANENLQTFFQ